MLCPLFTIVPAGAIPLEAPRPSSIGIVPVEPERLGAKKHRPFARDKAPLPSGIRPAAAQGPADRRIPTVI